MALIQLVVAWPVYDLLGRYPEFFVARQAQPGDIAFLVLVLSVALPLLLVGLQALAYGIHPKVGETVYALIIFSLLLLLGHLIANKLDASGYVTVWATLLALLFFFIYRRTQAVKLFVSFHRKQAGRFGLRDCVGDTFGASVLHHL